MKRGQVALLVVLIMVVILLFAVMSYMFFDSPTTGSVVEEEYLEYDPLAGIDNKCVIGLPFSCKMWEVSPDEDEIVIQLSNLLNENYLVKDISISGCNGPESSIYLGSGSAKAVTFSCQLERGNVFVGDVSVSYRNAKGGPSLDSVGMIIQIIE